MVVSTRSTRMLPPALRVMSPARFVVTRDAVRVPPAVISTEPFFVVTLESVTPSASRMVIPPAPVTFAVMVSTMVLRVMPWTVVTERSGAMSTEAASMPTLRASMVRSPAEETIPPVNVRAPATSRFTASAPP